MMKLLKLPGNPLDPAHDAADCRGTQCSDANARSAKVSASMGRIISLARSANTMRRFGVAYALPKLGIRLRSLPVNLTWVRDLEFFDGAILSEHREVHGDVYLMKWCAQNSAVSRWLAIRTEADAIAAYLDGKRSMRDLLNTDRGFLVDQVDNQIVAVWSVALAEIPEAYLPTRNAMHDPALRPG